MVAEFAQRLTLLFLTSTKYFLCSTSHYLMTLNDIIVVAANVLTDEKKEKKYIYNLKKK